MTPRDSEFLHPPDTNAWPHKFLHLQGAWPTGGEYITETACSAVSPCFEISARITHTGLYRTSVNAYAGGHTHA